MLGQTEEDALTGLYDYLGSEEWVEIIDGTNGRLMSWPTYLIDAQRNMATIQDNQVVELSIPSPDKIVLATILEELDEPRFVIPLFPIRLSPDYPFQRSRFEIVYPDQRLSITLQPSGWHNQPYLDLDSKSAFVSVQLNDLPDTAECYIDTPIVSWQGVGGLDIYYGTYSLLEGLEKECQL